MAASLGGAFSICLVREGCRPVGRKIIGPGNDPGFDGTQAWAAAIRKSPEVKVRQLDAVLKGEFKLARERRIFSWLANLETDIGVRTAGLKPTRMPRFFTMKDEGTAQARILILGFQHHRLGTIAASPTISVRGRNLALHVCANFGLKLNRGDVNTAFLKSQESETGIQVEPVHELRQAMTRPGSELRQKGCRLCDAPEEWFDEVTRILTQTRSRAMSLELCLWILGGHRGSCFCPRRRSASRLRTGPAKVHRIERSVDMGIMGGERVRPDGYGGHSAGRLEHAPILSTGSAKSMEDQRVDDVPAMAWKTACRSALGGLQILVSQGTNPNTAEPSITSSFPNEATFETVTRTNKLTHRPLSDPVCVTFA